MRFLKKPLPEIAPETIFKECVDSYRSTQTRDALLQALPRVKADSARYEQMVPLQIDRFLDQIDLNELPAKPVAGIYEEKFQPEKAPGRKYYEAIMSQTRNHLCPICDITMATTLDHYLPKSEVPTLSVTPGNLIPVCERCNRVKRDIIHRAPQEAPIHVYYDALPPGIWLHARIVYAEQPEVHYDVQCPEDWDPDLGSRLEQHMALYKLEAQFRLHAEVELTNMRRFWKRHLERGGPEGLSYTLADMQESLEENDPNSWKAALYRALASNIEALSAWL